jgi:hypothetical protein
MIGLGEAVDNRAVVVLRGFMIAIAMLQTTIGTTPFESSSASCGPLRDCKP